MDQQNHFTASKPVLRGRRVCHRLFPIALAACFAASAVHAAAPGGVVAWGFSGYGQTTVPVTGQTGVTATAAGGYHTVALRIDGSVVAWGRNHLGQTDVPPLALSGVMAVAAGDLHTVALKNDGSVLAWGDDAFGQTTVPVSAQSGVVAIAAGDRHTVALKTDGSVVAWGSDLEGQTTVPVAAQSGVMAVEAGEFHTVALKIDGSVVAWGKNASGQTTIPIAAQSGVTAIAAGNHHTLALKSDGSVIAWGGNAYGQTNVPLAAQSGVAAISAGELHNLVLKTNGSVIAWGWNGYGQTNVPFTLPATGVAIAAGGYHSVVLVMPSAPIITAPPLSQTVNAGENVNFIVGAAGFPSLTYQWRKDGIILGGATNATCSLTNVQPGHAGEYTVVVSNLLGGAASAPPAVLTVRAVAPTASVSIVAGQSIMEAGNDLILCASATGAPPPDLQWQFNGADLADETNACLYLFGVQAGQSGGYAIVASNVIGVVTSAVLAITIVEPPPVRINFSFGAPPFAVGSSQYLCAQSDLPEPATFQWRFNGTNLAEAIEPCLNLYPMPASAAGEYTVVATTASGSYTSLSVVVTTYYDPPYAAYPYMVFPEYSSTFPVVFAYVGEDVSLAAAYYGSPSFVQWRFNGVNLPGETNQSLAMLAVTTNQQGQYSFTATNVSGMTTSSVLLLIVGSGVPGFSQQPSNQSVVAGTTARLSFTARGGPPPIHWLERNGTNVAVPLTYEGYYPSSVSGFSLLDTTFADAGDYRIFASNSFGMATSVVFTIAVAPAGPLDRWTQRNPLPQSQALLSVAHGTNQFVAVGERGTIMTSPDGANWSLQNRRADVALNSVAWGGGQFVAVGAGGTILSSADGTNWAYRYTAPGIFLNAVTHADGRFVAVGELPGLSTLVMHSTNGIHWEKISLNGFFAQRAVTYGNGRFVAAGLSSIMVSTNGSQWSLAQGVSKQVESITYAGGLFVAVGDDGSILVSTNGALWLPRPSLSTRRLSGVTHGAGRFVAVGARGTLITSTDALTWTTAVSGTLDRLESVDFFGGVFVALGENGTIISSTDGLIWTKQNFGITRDLDGMFAANGTVVVVGKGGSILTSTNGVQFTAQNAGVTNDLHGVTWGGGLWVAVGEPGIVLTSTNTVYWTSRASGTTNSLKEATYANGQWIVVGTQGTIVRSTDGVNWLATGLPPLDLNDVAYGNGVFLVAGDGSNGQNGSLWRSTNGVNWTIVSPNIGKNLRGVTFANGLFLIAGNDGLLVTTTNGFGLKYSYIPSYYGNVRAAAWSQGLWIVVGNNGGIFTSPDLTNWTARASRTFENQHQVAFLDGHLLVIGNRGTILQSGRVLTELETPTFLVGTGFRLPFKGVIGRAYQVQASTNLVNWSTVAIFTNAAEQAVFTDTNALQFPRRFYRLLEP